MSDEPIPFPSSIVPRSKLTVKMPDGAGIPRSEIIPLDSARQPVWYDIAVCHHWDGTIETWCKGIDPEEPRARVSAAIALRTAADHYDPIAEFVDPCEIA